MKARGLIPSGLLLLSGIAPSMKKLKKRVIVMAQVLVATRLINDGLVQKKRKSAQDARHEERLAFNALELAIVEMNRGERAT